MDIWDFLTSKQLRNPIHLLYLAGNGEYLFKNELDEMENRILTSITYLDSRDEFYQEISTFSSQLKSNGKFYIAGPQSMIEDVNKYLLNHQVTKQNIKKDAFFGY